MTTVKLDNLASHEAARRSTIHPDYGLLAARLLVSNLHKQTHKKFSKVIYDLNSRWDPETRQGDPVISERVYNIVMKHQKELDEAIDHKRDFDYTYYGFKTMERSYLLRIDDKIVERPQHLIMRTAVEIHGENIPKVIETYTLMSKQYFTHASPTLFNAGTTRPQMSSGFLVGMKDDSMHGIYDTLKSCALISQCGGGIGLHVHNIRSSGTRIAGTNGTSSGVVPMLKVFNATARYVDQGGNRRPGAFTVYLEPWHGDIHDFLAMRKKCGNEEMRADDLFSALWIPDLFMKKVENNEDWCLFSPNKVPGLIDAYGSKFDDLYAKYEQEELYVKKVRAQDLWHCILEAQKETGGPFMMYKDACNKKSNQMNLGTIRSSNLCTEIVQYSSPEEVAVCNLASLALPNFVDQDEEKIWYDFEALHKVTKVVVGNLDAIIDLNWYPVPEAGKSNKRHRPLGVGVQGFADMLLAMRIPFQSHEARVLNIQVFETIYHAAIEASMELAEKFGAYETYNGSPASRGLFQFDLWEHKPTELWDWEELRDKVAKHGLRNSLLTALMPTASTSQILGFNECFEPYISNIYSPRLFPEHQTVNPWLLKDLARLGLWDIQMKERIVAAEGSIQDIESIPDELKLLYKTVWEISQKTVFDLSADRAPFIDQSQSLNIYLKNPTTLTSMHFYGWKKGLKTGMHYLRSKPATVPIEYEGRPEPRGQLGATRKASMSRVVCKEYVENKGQLKPSKVITSNDTTGILQVLQITKTHYPTHDDSDLSPTVSSPTNGNHRDVRGKRSLKAAGPSAEGTRKRRSLDSQQKEEEVKVDEPSGSHK